MDQDASFITAMLSGPALGVMIMGSLTFGIVLAVISTFILPESASNAIWQWQAILVIALLVIVALLALLL